MKTDWLKPLLVTGSFAILSASAAQAQIIDFTDEFAPANWTLTPDVNGGFIEFCGCDMELGLNGPDRYWFDQDGGDPVDFVNSPVRLEASVTIPFTGTMQFSYFAGTLDLRGWGNGGGTYYESLGYSINGVDYRLSPDSGEDPIFSDNYLGGGYYTIPLNAGDIFSFYLESLDSMGGTDDGFGGFEDSGDAAIFIEAFSFTAVPEPGEWMALAGVGLMGFAGVRRWRQSRAA